MFDKGQGFPRRSRQFGKSGGGLGTLKVGPRMLWVEAAEPERQLEPLFLFDV